MSRKGPRNDRLTLTARIPRRLVSHDLESMRLPVGQSLRAAFNDRQDELDRISADIVRFSAVLPVREQTVNFLAGLLSAERGRRGTRAGTRALPARDQAILVLRWFLDGTRMRQLARDNQISVSLGVRVAM